MEASKKYKLDELLELMGGYEYFSKSTYMYILHSLNGNNELADEYLAICIEENKAVTEKLNEMLESKKTQEE